MDVPMFVDLQGFVLNNKFFVKEMAVMSYGLFKEHYIFRMSKPWWLTKEEPTRPKADHGETWFRGFVSFYEAKNLIQETISRVLTEIWISASLDERPVIYVKGSQTREWLKDLLDDKILHSYIECLEENYSSIINLEKMSLNYDIICNNHHKLCALQNACKLANWWIAHTKEFDPQNLM